MCCYSPTLYIGEVDSVVYALPSLVDDNTVRVMVICHLLLKLCLVCLHLVFLCLVFTANVEASHCHMAVLYMAANINNNDNDN